MRKKTDPQTRKQNTTSSCEQSGLIANDKKRVQSARAKPALDNRSHRTFCVFRRPESRPSGRRRAVHRLSPRPLSSPAVASGRRPRRGKSVKTALRDGVWNLQYVQAERNLSSGRARRCPRTLETGSQGGGHAVMLELRRRWRRSSPKPRSFKATADDSSRGRKAREEFRFSGGTECLYC
jgi:hypothetical protein